MLKKILNFIKENIKFFIFLLLLYTFLNYELPYAIYTPGGAISMDERISGENTYDEEGSFSMTYVSMVKGSIPFLALSYIIPNWDIVTKDAISYNEDDLKETIEIDKIYMKEAISDAEYVAYNNAGIEYKELKNECTVTYISENAKTNLKYGDILVSIDGQKLNTLKELQNYVETKKIGDIVTIKYQRGNKEYEDKVTLIDIDGSPKVGISIASIREYETDFNIEVKTKSSESGPSGGLITALEIYNQITEEDITRGFDIMGTGTIDKDGIVGEIGGVKYKLIGAVKNGADIFICPKENYEEAIKIKEENSYDIKVYGVATFSEALEVLNKLEENQ